MSKRLVLRQAAVVFRHGDRSPGYNCMDPNPQAAAAEAATWAKMLPAMEESRTLSRLFPVITPHSETRDHGLGIFGSLTQMGVQQSTQLGKSLARRYAVPLGLRCAGAPARGRSMQICGTAVECYASNFRRTQLSAQAVLCGMCSPLATAADGNHPVRKEPAVVTVPGEGDEFLNVWGRSAKLQQLLKDHAKSDQGKLLKVAIEQHPEAVAAKDAVCRLVPAFQFSLQRFLWMSVMDLFHCRSSAGLGTTHGVRPHGAAGQPWSENSLSETANLFRHDPHQQTTIADDPAVSDGFWYETARVRRLFQSFDRDGDGKLSRSEFSAALKEVLRVAALTSKDLDYFFGALDGDGNGFVDYNEFAQFMSGGLPTTPELSRAFQAGEWPGDHGNVAQRVVGSWFHQWLSVPSILSAALSGLADRALLGMQATADWHESDPQSRDAVPPAPLTLFAGHDVTLLPMLFAVGAWVCPIGEEAGGPAPRWPGYSAALAFELYESIDTEGEGECTNHSAARDWVVKVAYRPGAECGNNIEAFAHSEWETLLTVPFEDFRTMIQRIRNGTFEVSA